MTGFEHGIPSLDDPSKVSIKWLQIERGQLILVFGKDSRGTFLAIFEGDLQHQAARFDTSLAELIGLMELWKRS